MNEIKFDITKSEYNHKDVVEKYKKAVSEIGLWKSEEIVFEKHINQSDKILDLGCGAGRTTFVLHERGYKCITGLDLSNKMIESCYQISKQLNVDIPFVCASATDLPFESENFEVCIFSFNGIMTIPLLEVRQKAFEEIARVLKPNGIFIFTTHNIETPDFIDYWKAEKQRWDNNTHDKRLYEYGDLVFTKPDDYGDAISFVHIPVNGEIETCLKKVNLSLIYREVRSSICDESDAIKEFSVDCKFWVAKKR